MLRLKPTNIFDFYAPTGGLSKIADFSMRQKNMGATPASTTINGTSRSAYSPPPLLSSPAVRTSSNSNQQWFYWLCGAVIIVAAIDYLAERSNEDEKNNKN